MEKSTIKISLEDYNELRDFKINIEKGNTLFVACNLWQNKTEFISTDEAVKKIAFLNEELLGSLEKLIKENQELTSKLNNIKKMSYFKFLKWCKK